MNKISLAFSFLLLTASACRQAAPPPQPVRGGQLMLRLDDVGMNHAVNLAIKEVAETGIPFSVSVLFACPWYQEAVTILKKHPQISVGVHLALNSEWRDYRWGPVLGAAAVPSLVDTNGYFFHTGAAFRAGNPSLAEVERELTAQVERALRSGLKIDYVDHHMGTAASTPELRTVVERIAAKYNLGISGYFGESFYDLFAVAPGQKTDSLTRRMRSLDATRPTIAIIHVAEDTPDMRALFDMNYAPMNTPAGEPLTWTHRKAELEMLLSADFARALRETGTKLITYNDVIRTNGLRSMRRPGTN